MPYIYSTLSCDIAYTAYIKGGADLPIVTESVLVRGKANINYTQNIKGIRVPVLLTVRGVATEVSDQQLEALKQDKCFQEHVKGGYIVVDANESDAEMFARNMTAKDKSAPKTPQDFPAGDDGEKPVPVVEKSRKK